MVHISHPIWHQDFVLQFWKILFYFFLWFISSFTFMPLFLPEYLLIWCWSICIHHFCLSFFLFLVFHSLPYFPILYWFLYFSITLLPKSFFFLFWVGSIFHSTHILIISQHCLHSPWLLLNHSLFYLHPKSAAHLMIMPSYYNILFLILLLSYVDFQAYLHISCWFQYLVHTFYSTLSPNIMQQH